ncbi:MAG: hypothetical protein LBN97_10040 [Oscillospiraceae bacterium]|jgi:hypothetical protein|nr:hypothetical protein [Oscillospiraceae bacterium]
MRIYEGYLENGRFEPTRQVTLPNHAKVRVAFLDDDEPRFERKNSTKSFENMTIPERLTAWDEVKELIHAGGDEKINEADFPRLKLRNKDWWENPEIADWWEESGQ